MCVCQNYFLVFFDKKNKWGWGALVAEPVKKSTYFAGFEDNSISDEERM